MDKYKFVKLDNGLKVILCPDKTKNQSIVDIEVNYGGNTLNYEVDGKKYDIKEGTAHLLEHFVVESSPYGNIDQYFENDIAVRYNANTNSKHTLFFINIVRDFDKCVKELINIVNNPIFDKDKLEIIKGPVLQEIKKDDDKVTKKFLDEKADSLFINNKYKTTLGKYEEVKNISIDELKRIYDVFYQVSNQTIMLIGNFDTDHIINLIKEEYSKVNLRKIDYKVLDMETSTKVNISHKEITTTKDVDYTNITFKIGLDRFNAKEKNYLTYYLYIYLDYLFGKSSDAYKFIYDNKYSLYSIEYSYDMYNENILLINIGYVGTNLDMFKKLVFDCLKKQVDKEFFYASLNKSIIRLMLRNSSFEDRANNFISNILDFNYYSEDLVEDVSSLNIDELNDYISRLDFNNYIEIVQTKVIDN